MSTRVHLDGLLAAAIAGELDLPPVGTQSAEDQQRIRELLVAEVSQALAIEPGRRFFLCSDSQMQTLQHERRFINRRFPAALAVELGSDRLRRVEMGTGLSKSYRIPQSVAYADSVAWYALGNAEGFRRLLGQVTHLGRRRAVGCGAVQQWIVEDCEPWNGFPILRDGVPLRPLPLDYPGLRADHHTDMRALCFPHWEIANEQPCACP